MGKCVIVFSEPYEDKDKPQVKTVNEMREWVREGEQKKNAWDEKNSQSEHKEMTHS